MPPTRHRQKRPLRIAAADALRRSRALRKSCHPDRRWAATWWPPYTGSGLRECYRIKQELGVPPITITSPTGTRKHRHGKKAAKRRTSRSILAGTRIVKERFSHSLQRGWPPQTATGRTTDPSGCRSERFNSPDMPRRKRLRTDESVFRTRRCVSEKWRIIAISPASSTQFFGFFLFPSLPP